MACEDCAIDAAKLVRLCYESHDQHNLSCTCVRVQTIAHRPATTVSGLTSAMDCCGKTSGACNATSTAPISVFWDTCAEPGAGSGGQCNKTKSSPALNIGGISIMLPLRTSFTVCARPRNRGNHVDASAAAG
eukprot:366366-Chlamydomonas_euryale.AAC.28